MTARASRLRPFCMDDFKVAVFIYLANLEIVGINHSQKVEDEHYMVRFRTGAWHRLIDRITLNNEPFPLYLWQIYGWLSKGRDARGREVPGALDWLENSANAPFLILPMTLLKRRRRYRVRMRTFKGPAPMLDGFSWQRFRYAQDFMDNYIRNQNILERLLKMGRRASAADIAEALRNVDRAKALFLATIFDAKIKYVDESTGRCRHDWRYCPTQSTDNAPYFRRFSDIDWQIILMWWSGIMQWLGRTYPRVYKKQPTKGKKLVNPLEVYARTTATMEKYIGINAKEVDAEPYTTIIQQMEDIAKQNEEFERMRKK